MKVIKKDTLSQIGNSVVNCYLVEEADSLTLIDTGPAFFAKEIIRQSQLLRKPIGNILLTHSHMDHIGGMDKLISLLPPGPNLLRLPRDGERVGSLEAIATPGHTEDSLSFIDLRNRYLIVGDAMQTAGGVAVAGKIQLLFPFPGLATQNKREAVKSAEKLLERSPALLAPGHGAMLANPQKAIRMAIIEAQRALK
ncbi:MAG: MBL fold metallo-hydrolase [Eubacteriales bacterium]